jgi:2,6-dihydroxypyridine 3-monooxygenase
MDGMRAAIVGGSLGGLGAALLLRDAGVEVDVYERSPSELAQRGAGIGFFADARRYLVERAGVPLERVCTMMSYIRYLNRQGERILNAHHPYTFSSWTTIYRTFLGLFGPARYHLGHEMTGWIETGDAVEVHFAGRPSQRADLLVCADGVNSTARALLLPEVKPVYSGYVAWRGMVPEAELDAATCAAFDDAITYYVYANSHILAYPIPGHDGSLVRGERLINFVWYRNYLEGSDLDSLMTDAGGQRRDTPRCRRARSIRRMWRSCAPSPRPACRRRWPASSAPRRSPSCRRSTTSRCRAWPSAAPA